MIHKTPCYGRNESFDWYPSQSDGNIIALILSFMTIVESDLASILQIFALPTLHLKYSLLCNNRIVIIGTAIWIQFDNYLLLCEGHQRWLKSSTVKTGFKRISQEQKNEHCFMDPAPNDGPPFDAIPGGTVRHRRLFFVFSKCKRASKVQTRHTGVLRRWELRWRN